MAELGGSIQEWAQYVKDHLSDERVADVSCKVLPKDFDLRAAHKAAELFGANLGLAGNEDGTISVSFSRKKSVPRAALPGPCKHINATGLNRGEATWHWCSTCGGLRSTAPGESRDSTGWELPSGDAHENARMEHACYLEMQKEASRLHRQCKALEEQIDRERRDWQQKEYELRALLKETGNRIRAFLDKWCANG